MRMLRRYSLIVAFAVSAIGTGIFLGLSDWPQPGRTLEFSGLILAAIVTSALAVPRSGREDRATVLPCFVIQFASLLLLGPHATMLVSVGGLITRGLVDQERPYPYRRWFSNAATVMLAIQAAGLALQSLGGTTADFMWPWQAWQAVPIAAAVVGYCLVTGASAEVIVPLVTRSPINRSWPTTVLGACPNHFIAASLAVGIVAVIDHGMWEVLPAAAVPLYFAYRAHYVYVNGLEDEHRRSQAIESLHQGM